MSRLTLPVPADFQINRAVCSYGYFLLAPNHWDPTTQRLTRPLALPQGVVTTAISQRETGAALRITCDRRIDRNEASRVRAAVTRMLRVDHDPRPWYRIQPEAKHRGFGRMFRSPTLFEDMVKTITGCNVTWRNTIGMNTRLCAHFGADGVAFPTAAKLARCRPETLKRKARVGYRAERIVALAKVFTRGDVDPEWLEHPTRTADDAYHAVLGLHGFGPYAAANVLQLLGHYDHLPIDTETYRHYCLVHGIDRPADEKTLHPLIEAYYEPFRPYRFKAYWFELWRDYERRFGDAWTWDRETTGANFTASTLNNPGA